MAQQLGSLITVKKCRREHACWWCAEPIPVGSSYDKWTWEDNRELTTIKVHPECRKAWHELSDAEGYPAEVMFGEFERPGKEKSEFNLTPG